MCAGDVAIAIRSRFTHRRRRHSGIGRIGKRRLTTGAADLESGLGFSRMAKGLHAWSRTTTLPVGSEGRHPGNVFCRFFPWVVGIFLAFWLVSDTSYTVKPYEQAVVLRFGKYHATTMPGLHFKAPLVDQVMKVSVEEHGLRLPFGVTSRTEFADQCHRPTRRKRR